jgi:hypothetical protein
LNAGSTSDAAFVAATNILKGITDAPGSLSVALGQIDSAVSAKSLSPLVGQSVQQPSFIVTTSSASVAEGGTEVFNVATTGVAPGTLVSYTITGTGNAASLSESGVLTLDASGKATVAVVVPTNATVGDSGTLTMTLGNGKTVSATVTDATVAPTFAVAASGNISEGGTETFTVTTTGVAPGTQLAYQVTGTGNAAGNTTSGLVTIDSSGKGLVSVAVPANATLGDSGTLQFSLVNGKATSSAVTVADATVVPTYAVGASGTVSA